MAKKDISDSAVRQAKIIVGVMGVAATISVVAIALISGISIVVVVVSSVLLLIAIWLGLRLSERLTKSIRR